jgi:glycosyltransferase involved in cell wall biosynthesis
MRILMLSDFYPPTVGGVERHVQSLSQELVHRGHEVTVASIAQGRSEERDVDRGVIVIRKPMTLARLPRAYAESARPFAPPAPDPELVAGLARIAAQTRPDVVHAHGWIVHSYLPVLGVVRRPLVMTLHEYGLVCAKKNLVYLGRTACSGPAFAKCLRCASRHYGPARGIPITLAGFAAGPLLRRVTDRFIAVSEAVAESNRLGGWPYEVIPNFLARKPAVAIERTAPWIAQLPECPFLLFVGALGAHKGLAILFEAYRSLTDPPPLVAIGHRWVDTPATVPPGVRLLEDWPHEAVLAAWQRSMLGLIPSTWPEPFGIVALEAMQAGVPLVASAVGGLADIVEDGNAGLLVPPGDPDALARAITRLLADPAARATMSAAGRRAAEGYAAELVVPRIEAVYRAVVRARAAKTARSTVDPTA